MGEKDTDEIEEKKMGSKSGMKALALMMRIFPRFIVYGFSLFIVFFYYVTKRQGRVSSVLPDTCWGFCRLSASHVGAIAPLAGGCGSLRVFPLGPTHRCVLRGHTRCGEWTGTALLEYSEGRPAT